MKTFKNKVVVITGAGSGMGRAYAMAFARLGAKLALNDYDREALGQSVALLPEPARSDCFHQHLMLPTRPRLPRSRRRLNSPWEMPM